MSPASSAAADTGESAVRTSLKEHLRTTRDRSDACSSPCSSADAIQLTIKENWFVPHEWASMRWRNSWSYGRKKVLLHFIYLLLCFHSICDKQILIISTVSPVGTCALPWGSWKSPCCTHEKCSQPHCLGVQVCSISHQFKAQTLAVHPQIPKIFENHTKVLQCMDAGVAAMKKSAYPKPCRAMCLGSDTSRIPMWFPQVDRNILEQFFSEL